jgi:hypothetical protein
MAKKWPMILRSIYLRSTPQWKILCKILIQTMIWEKNKPWFVQHGMDIANGQFWFWGYKVKVTETLYVKPCLINNFSYTNHGYGKLISYNIVIINSTWLLWNLYKYVNMPLSQTNEMAAQQIFTLFHHHI